MKWQQVKCGNDQAFRKLKSKLLGKKTHYSVDKIENCNSINKECYDYLCTDMISVHISSKTPEYRQFIGQIHGFLTMISITSLE